jgi:lipopolysaccharide export system protein LptA
MPRLAGLAAAVLATTALPAQGTAGRPCDLVFDNTDSTRMLSVQILPGVYQQWFGGGVRARCRGDDVRLDADSAEYRGDTRVLTLVGRVRYREPRVRVDADNMVYFEAPAFLIAEGNVDAVTDKGSRMRGPRAEVYRAMPGIRTRQQIVAPMRPRLALRDPDAPGDTVPTLVDADRIFLDGDSLVYAGGNVEITRPDLFARADSAQMDAGTGRARLMRAPRIEGKKRTEADRPFVMTGTTIDLYNAEDTRELARVVAQGNATVVSDSLNLAGDTVDVRLSGERIDRVIAWGRGTARATSPERDIRADSIDIEMPGQRIHRLTAIGAARAETRPDTAVKSDERDWVAGDRIVAEFDSVAATDTTQPPLRSLEAVGNAKAYYQVPPKAGAEAQRPGVNYVTGKRIDVAFSGGDLQRVVVRDQAVGIFLEAAADSASARRAAAPAAGRRP